MRADLRSIANCVLISIILLLICVAIAIPAGVYSGVYDVAATRQHSAVMAWLLHTTAVRSIDLRARDIRVPPLSEADSKGRGLALFQQHCAQCHGAPGEAPRDFAKGLLPGPPRLGKVGRESRPRDIFWVIDHGIKMTAMPAWAFRMSRRDIWALVGFIQMLPKISPAEYQEMRKHAGTARIAISDEPPTPTAQTTPDPKRGEIALAQYGCGACHTIPGLSGPGATVGPTLSGIGSRLIIAGMLANTPENMRAWIRDPQKIKPGDEMPGMGVTQRDAADMAAYLQSLR